MGIYQQLGRWPKVAMISTGLVTVGSYALMCKFRSKFDNSNLYKNAVEALHNDSRITNALGKPVTVYSTDLGLIEFEKNLGPSEKTFVKEDEIQLKIPVMGTKYGGNFYARCKVESVGGDCVMNELFVVANGRRADVQFPGSSK